MSHNHVRHSLRHPDVHYASQPWSELQTLHVATAYSNPKRFEARRKLFNIFRRHMHSAPNVELHVGELAYGDRPFEVTQPNHPGDVQLRTCHELWHKENVLNTVIGHFPSDWQYGAYVDGDWTFTRHDWALEAIHLLQHYDWVQLFSSYTDLSSDHRPIGMHAGFVYNLLERGNVPRSYAKGSPGGAWAFRRSALEAVGGLLDICILGSADWHMACGLAGVVDHRPEAIHCGSAYRRAIQIWQERATSLRHNIGYLPGHCLHGWHGSKSQRGYSTRWQILRDCQFDPHVDIYRDWQGVWQLNPHKPHLRDAIRKYFHQRNEDDLALRGGEKPLI